MFRPRWRIPRALRPCLTPSQMPQRNFAIAPLPDNIKDGIPGFLDAEDIDIGYTQYTELILRRLTRMVEGTGYADETTRDLARLTAREPSEAHLFNHASMAWNTHFFYSRLSPTKNEVPPSLLRSLEISFGSLNNLQQEFFVTAATMFGPGFVWLVKADKATHPNGFYLLNTYLAGSPFAYAHWRQQSIDMNTTGRKGSLRAELEAKDWLSKTAQRPSGAEAGGPKKPGKAPGAIETTPVLCVSTWEHVWLRRYGVKGKRQFLRDWWDHIDWAAVQDATGKNDKALLTGGRR